MNDSEDRSVPASYSRVLDRMEAGRGGAARPTANQRPEAAEPPAEAAAKREKGGRPGKAGKPAKSPRRPKRPRLREPATAPWPAASGRRGGDAVTALTPPRRRDMREALRIRLSSEQFYWLRLSAARAGGKLDESTIIAAAIRLLEQLDIDWCSIDSRRSLAGAMAEAARHSDLFAAAGEDDQAAFAGGAGMPSPELPEPLPPAPGLPDRSAPLTPPTMETGRSEREPGRRSAAPPDPTSST